MQVTDLSCLLLEDDAHTRDMIVSVVQQSYPNIKLTICSNIAEANTYLNSVRIDFCILDINLPDGNSYDWLAEVYKSDNATLRIIFITAYSSYAVKAFRFNALDFLLKPFSPPELQEAVQRVLNSIHDEHRLIELQTALKNMGKTNIDDQDLVLKTQSNTDVLKLGMIVYLSSDNNYCNFHLTDGRKIMISRPLKYYHDRLQDSGFLRVHQSFLVNRKHIITFKKNANQLLLTNQDIVPVSQSRRSRLAIALESKG